jgi:hypothetical protein
MPAKRSGNKGTRKNSTPTDESMLRKPMKHEIVIQDLPKPSKRVHTAPEAGSTEEEKFHSTITETPTSQNVCSYLIYFVIRVNQAYYGESVFAE